MSNPLTPMSAGTVSRTVSGATASVALAKTGQNQSVMVTSPATNALAFIEFGDSTVTSVIATGTPILPGAIMTFSVASSVTHAAAIGTAGTLYFTCGQGD